MADESETSSHYSLISQIPSSGSNARKYALFYVNHANGFYVSNFRTHAIVHISSTVITLFSCSKATIIGLTNKLEREEIYSLM